MLSSEVFAKGDTVDRLLKVRDPRAVMPNPQCKRHNKAQTIYNYSNNKEIVLGWIEVMIQFASPSPLHIGLDQTEEVGKVVHPDKDVSQNDFAFGGDLLIDGGDKGDIGQSQCGDVGNSAA